MSACHWLTVGIFLCTLVGMPTPFFQLARAISKPVSSLMRCQYSSTCHFFPLGTTLSFSVGAERTYVHMNSWKGRALVDTSCPLQQWQCPGLVSSYVRRGTRWENVSGKTSRPFGSSLFQSWSLTFSWLRTKRSVIRERCGWTGPTR